MFILLTGPSLPQTFEDASYFLGNFLNVLDKRQTRKTIGVAIVHYYLNYNCKANDINLKNSGGTGGIDMVKIGIITGSTRDSRVNMQVAEWVKSIADKRTDAAFELVDIKEYNLPRFNESIPPVMSGGSYETPEAKRWSEKISEFDGFIFVAPEYNKAIPSGLKKMRSIIYTASGTIKQRELSATVQR